MSGHNHYAWCDCGWCVKHRCARPIRRPELKPSITVDSFTIPNASCPVCGQRVFFYQNAYGSRVFFDDLGPPWPKHPCTDNANPNGRNAKSSPSPSMSGRLPVRPIMAWKSQGWIPLRLEKIENEDGWTVLHCRTIPDDMLVRILTVDRPTITKNLPLYMLPWDHNGYTEIEYLDHKFMPHHLWGWKYSDWFLRSAADALIARRAAST